jgi:hypothetical protein
MADWNWWPQFHDPSLRLSLRDQLAVHWDANLRMLRDWRACVAFVWISLLPVPLLFLLPAAVMLNWDGTSPAAPALAALAFLLYLFLQHLAFAAAMRRTYIPFVRIALTAQGHPTCLRCGHPLGPVPPAACPECGSAHREPG